MSEYELESLMEQNLDRLAPLMRDAFGHRDVHLGYSRWKHPENPARPAIGLFAISRVTGAAATFCGMMPEACRSRSARWTCMEFSGENTADSLPPFLGADAA